MAKGWRSNVDVRATSSLAGGFSYQKKYLLKNIDAEKADSKALKTLALCWAFRKRAFSVSGSFRQLLSDLIRYLHNSNRKLQQVTLEGKVLRRFKFFVIGFVPAHILQLRGDRWFVVLDFKRISSVEAFFSSLGR